MAQTPNLRKDIYNAFNPSNPLPAGDPAYVDCAEVRGETDIVTELGSTIELSDGITCQLYAGHRGAGKSTELLRLKQYLENTGCFVVYFPADEEDINLEDTQYTDILLACTRHLLEELENANPKPLLDWLKNRWEDLKELAVTEIAFESLTPELQITQYAKLTANLRAVPSLRQKIREKVNPHTTTLIESLNRFISDAKKKLPSGYSQLAVIADNLDRIVPTPLEGGRNSHDEIFLDRSEQLKALDCHVIYTLPISMVYSQRAADLRDIYSDSDPQVLPMIMVQMPAGDIYELGFNTIKEVIAKRVNQVAPHLSLETEVFDSPDTLQHLCLMSGGHVRNLLLLIRAAIVYATKLPISATAVQRAIAQARDTYRRTVENDQWSILAEASRSHRIVNEDEHRSLLFNRCLLEYRYYDDREELQRWCDVHPLIKGIQESQEALAKL